MADFPTLSVTGKPRSHKRMYCDDPTLRISFSGGYEETRAAFTRTRPAWDLEYGPMLEDDKDTLLTFFDTVGMGGNAFNWTDPATGEVESVRLANLPTCVPAGDYMIVDKTRWWVKFSIRGV